MAINVSDSQFAQYVQQALRQLPRQFLDALENVTIEVQVRPPAGLGGRGPGLLLGLFQGVPLTKRGVHPAVPARILIFKENLQRVCSSQAELVEQIRRTVLHELGHYFGMSEQQLRDLAY